jgi:glyoxylase I family protein
VVISPAVFQRVCRARAILQADGDSTQTIAAVARVVGLSPFHLIRCAAARPLNAAQFSTSSRSPTVTASPSMRIKLNSIMVDDQDKALRFYTEVLGFKKSKDIPVGGPYRWITVVSAEGPGDLELVLEPNANPAGKTFQTALFEQGIPATAFESSDVAADYDRLAARGVAFTRPPTKAGPVTIAVFSDTCGNLIQIYQPT